MNMPKPSLWKLSRAARVAALLEPWPKFQGDAAAAPPSSAAMRSRFMGLLEAMRSRSMGQPDE